MRFLHLLFGSVLIASAAAAADVAVGSPAPAWHLTDLEGKTIQSTDLKGKVVVIDFWATWCGPCKKEIPSYIALEKKYGPNGLVIVGVAMDTTSTPVKRYVSEHDLNYEVGMSNDEIYKAFNSPDAIPTTILIDREGVIRDIKLGGVKPDVYEQRVAKLLNP